MEYNERNMWESAYEKISEFNDPVHVVLHLGGQIDLSRAFNEATQLLSMHAHTKHKAHLVEKVI